MSPTISFEDRFRFRTADWILIALLALLSLSPLSGGGGDKAGEWVRVRTPSATYRYRLDRERRIPIAGSGGRMVLLIEKGTARVLETECPQKICQRSGRIQRPGQQIICVPFRIEVIVEGRSREGDVQCR